MDHHLDTQQKKTAQQKLRNIVTLYKQMFPDEYDAVCVELSQLRNRQNDKFASVKGDHAIDRALFEIPETLFAGILSNLDEEQLLYFKSKEGSRWFVTAFKEFRAAQEV